jgi:hypothetical protein
MAAALLPTYTKRPSAPTASASAWGFCISKEPACSLERQLGSPLWVLIVKWKTKKSVRLVST